MILSCAHECFIDEEAKEEFIVYQGLSPDEITLVDAASRLGFKFLGKKSNMLEIEVLGNKTEVELLHLFPFDSDRKRMTVIVKINGEYKMYCKGADSIIYSRLSEKLE
jgi:magnesium-transporting ATPase (P-type)